MSYELKTLEDGLTLYLRVVETPPPADAHALNERISQDLRANRRAHLMVDYRDMVKSDFDATIARAILLQMDRLVQNFREVPPRSLKVAMVSTEGTFGHGIARMTAGNAYGLNQVDLRHFVDCAAARLWLRAAD